VPTAPAPHTNRSSWGRGDQETRPANAAPRHVNGVPLDKELRSIVHAEPVRS
jgi:hypothetical protein